MYHFIVIKNVHLNYNYNHNISLNIIKGYPYYNKTLKVKSRVILSIG